MFHIYRKASTVLVWLGAAGPNTCLGADMVNIDDENWQEDGSQGTFEVVKNLLAKSIHQTRHRGGDIKTFVDKFINDLRDLRLSDGFDILKLISMAIDGLADLLGRPWSRRTWVIQEFAAAVNVEFHCGRSVLSEDGFFDVAPDVALHLWHTRSVLLKYYYKGTMLKKRYKKRPIRGVLPDMLDPKDRDVGPSPFDKISDFANVLHDLRRVVNDPRRVKTVCMKTEVLLMLFVETASLGFEASVAADRLYSLTAMADAISRSSRSLVPRKRMASSPQQLPVDYNVDLRVAILRALKLCMNETGYFYLTDNYFQWLFDRAAESRQRWWKLQEAQPTLLSICAADSSPPTWFRLLEFNSTRYWNIYFNIGGIVDDAARAAQASTSLSWTEQDLAEPDTLKVRGKALGRLLVDFGGHPSQTWVALPCHLGQEFETCCEYQLEKPVRALDQGRPDERHAAADGACLDNTQTDGERRRPPEPQMELEQIKNGSYYMASHREVVFWRWQFPPSARDGDIIAVLVDTCALLRPSHASGRYEFIRPGLRVPVVSSTRLSSGPECRFLDNHLEDLDTFILI